jgi:ferredoxin-NADP reductase
MSVGDDDTDGLPIVSPANMLPVQVVRREVIAPEVVSLFLALPGTGQAPAPYQPGQFVTLALPTPRQTIYRSYSLSGDGNPSQPWEITIKRLQLGVVSTYLYDSVEEGSLLYASLPRGTFTLPADLQPDMSLVFVAIGSGITPIMGMLSALARLPLEHRPEVHLHYAARSLVEMIYRRELQQLDPRERWLHKWYYLSSDGNRLTPETVLRRARHVALQAHWYMCGPESLKLDLFGLLEDEGVPDEQIHAEIFTPQTARPSRSSGSLAPYPGPGAGPVTSLKIAETGAALNVGANETLLAALERQGYRPDFSCRAGACGVCKLRVLSGQVNPVGDALSAAERRAGYVLSCVAKPVGDVTLASGGRAPAPGTAVAAAVPGAALAKRRATTMQARFAAVLAVGGLLFGSWNLTNHKPHNPQTTTSSAPGITTTQAPGQASSPTGQPSAAGTQAGTTKPTATTAPGSAQPTSTTPAGSTQPTPTTAAGSTQPTPTPTAKPKPPTPVPTTQSGTTKP